MIISDIVSSQLSNNNYQTEWRRSFAKQVADELDMGLFGVKGIYLCGSVESGKAGMGSDIDLILRIDSSEEQEKAMLEWLGRWDSKLCNICEQHTGRKPCYMLDVHLVSDSDMEKKTCFAQKIQSTLEPAEPLRIAK